MPARIHALQVNERVQRTGRQSSPRNELNSIRTGIGREMEEGRMTVRLRMLLPTGYALIEK